MNVYQPVVDVDAVARIVKSQIGVRGVVNVFVISFVKVIKYFRKGAWK